MKILSAQQIRDADAFTIANEPIASIDLMERASLAFIHWFVDEFDATNPVKVFCGSGNNGGDGLAIARLLSQRGYHVETYVVRVSEEQSDDFRKNLDQLSNITNIHEIKSESQIPVIEPNEIVVDALFGSGLTRQVDGLFAQVIRHINAVDAITISVDIPSGLFSDYIVRDSICINATYTISFQVPKLAFFLPINFDFIGEWAVVDIGLNIKYVKSLTSKFSTIDAPFIKQHLFSKNKNDHKGSNGRAMLIVGSFGKMGAAVLASKGALRSGLGLLTVHAPHCGYTILQTAVPEAMVSPDQTEYYFGEVPETDQYDAIGIGPGLDTKQKSIAAFEALLKKYKKPLIVDADGINILSTHSNLISLLFENSIITPHYKEFERLVGTWKDDLDRIEKQIQFAKAHKIIVVFKGPYTTIVSPEGEVFFNTTGNAGMATGGSGDVLTGLITGILAQGYPPLVAAQMGVYLHGLAGDYAARSLGVHAMIASDIIANIHQAFNEIVES